MDREKLAASGTKSRARGGAAAGKATKPCAALSPAEGVRVTLGPHQLQVTELTLNDTLLISRDVCGVEEFFARIGEFDPEAVRYFVWLTARKSVPELTVEAVGDLIPAHSARQAELLFPLFAASGLMETGEKKGPEASPPTGDA